MQLEISDEEASVLTDCIEMLIEQHRHAKDHTLSCPSVESAEMLTEVVADYDLRLRALKSVQDQLRSASV
jgi:hypothetical protein